jgi:hypothetical protein
MGMDAIVYPAADWEVWRRVPLANVKGLRRNVKTKGIKTLSEERDQKPPKVLGLTTSATSSYTRIGRMTKGIPFW